ncbi:MAG: hypothetical protein JST48_07230 [Bacteroidetes bacterium]|nr:hypothetical protein [Bacteroidota bacterium]
MNTLSQFLFISLKSILLQSAGSTFQMSTVLSFASVVIVISIVVLIYAYLVLQLVLQKAGLIDLEVTLSTQWIKILFVLTLGMGIAAFSIYSKLI